MGGAESVPAPDLRVRRAMAIGKLDMKDVAVFWKKFRKLDKEMRGNIEVESFYDAMEEKRSIYGDGVFELLDINHVGTINFGEFIQSIVVMCLFEREEVMKYCFYVFDKDKNGYVEKDELHTMLNVFHHVGPNEELKGNQKIAKKKMNITAEDVKIEFDEVKKIALTYPSLWYPAFRIQNNLMTEYMGHNWWSKKKRYLQDMKELKARKKKEKELEADAKFERLRQRKIRKKMGILKYYCTPWTRKNYDKMFPPRNKDEVHKMSAEELAELRRKAREEAKRLEELQIKNPETQEWRNYMRAKDSRKKMKIEAELLSKDKPLPRPKASVDERQARIERRRLKFHGEELPKAPK